MTYAERTAQAEKVDLIRRAMAREETEARAELYCYRQCGDAARHLPKSQTARLAQLELDRSRLDDDPKPWRLDMLAARYLPFEPPA